MEELATIQKAVSHAHAQWDTLEMCVTRTLTNAQPAPLVRMKELATIRKAVSRAHAQWDLLETFVTQILMTAHQILAKMEASAWMDQTASCVCA